MTFGSRFPLKCALKNCPQNRPQTAPDFLDGYFPHPALNPAARRDSGGFLREFAAWVLLRIIFLLNGPFCKLRFRFCKLGF